MHWKLFFATACVFGRACAQGGGCSDDADGVLDGYGMSCELVQTQVGCDFDFNAYDSNVPVGTLISAMCPITCGGGCTTASGGGAADDGCSDTMQQIIGQDCSSTIALLQSPTFGPLLSMLGLDLSADPGCGTDLKELVARGAQFLSIAPTDRFATIADADTVGRYCPVTCNSAPAGCGPGTAGPAQPSCSVESLQPVLVGSCSNMAGMGAAFCGSICHDDIAAFAQRCASVISQGTDALSMTINSLLTQCQATPNAGTSMMADCPFDPSNLGSPCHTEACSVAAAGAAEECCAISAAYCAGPHGSHDAGCSDASFTHLISSFCPQLNNNVGACHITGNVYDCNQCQYAWSRELSTCTNCDNDGNVLTAQLLGRHPQLVWCRSLPTANPAPPPSTTCDTTELQAACADGIPDHLTFLQLCGNPCSRWFADHVQSCPPGTYEQMGLDTSAIASFDALEVACIENANSERVHVPKTVGVATFNSDGVTGTVSFSTNQDGTTDVSVLLNGLRYGPNTWHIHQSPVGGSTAGGSSTSCDSTGGHFTAIDGWDLGSELGTFNAASVSHQHQTIQGRLLPVTNIIGKSIVIHKFNGQRWVCATIIGEMQITGGGETNPNPGAPPPTPDNADCSAMVLMTECTDTAAMQRDLCSSSCGVYITEHYDCVMANSLVDGDNLAAVQGIHTNCATQSSRGQIGDGLCDAEAIRSDCAEMDNDPTLAANPQAVCGAQCGATIMGEFPDCIQALQDNVLAPPGSFLRTEVDDIVQRFGGIAALCSGEHQECLDRFHDPAAALRTTILPNCCSNSGQCTDWYAGACPKSCAQQFVPFYSACGELLYAMQPDVAQIRTEIEAFSQACDEKYAAIDPTTGGGGH